MKSIVLLACVLLGSLGPIAAGVAMAQESADPVAAKPDEALAPQGADTQPVVKDPTKGIVTNLDIPRFVTLKSGEGNARRGPGLTHKIDWVFTRSGMPLKVTAEHENWRKVEDSEGMGGWVHYSLLSGSRSILVTRDLSEFYDFPDPKAQVLFQAERGVVGKVLECQPDWCRINIQGEKGWAPKSSLWGVDAVEVIE